MERLQVAIAKARAERHGVIGKVDGYVPAAPPEFVPTSQTVTPRSAVPAPEYVPEPAPALANAANSAPELTAVAAAVDAEAEADAVSDAEAIAAVSGAQEAYREKIALAEQIAQAEQAVAAYKSASTENAANGDELNGLVARIAERHTQALSEKRAAQTAAAPVKGDATAVTAKAKPAPAEKVVTTEVPVNQVELLEAVLRTVQQQLDVAKTDSQNTENAANLSQAASVGKALNEASLATSNEPATAVDAPATDVPQAKTADKAPAQPEFIQYTRTRVATMNEALLKENRVIAGFRHDPRVEVYRQLRSKLLMQMKKNNWNTLAVTGTGENVGKTLTAINLAISISQEVNQTVLLVDLDLSNPSVHTTLGIETETGVVDCLLGDETIESTLVNPGFSRLVIAPGRAQENYSSELLTSPKMRALMQEITNRYASRIIIFDLPPLLRNDDALVFIPQVDATLLVVEDGVTTADQVERCQRLLKTGNNIGTILNKARH